MFEVLFLKNNTDVSRKFAIYWKILFYSECNALPTLYRSINIVKLLFYISSILLMIKKGFKKLNVFLAKIVLNIIETILIDYNFLNKEYIFFK